MKHKSEASFLIQSFYILILTQFKLPIKIIRSDNGPEFALNSFYASKGIVHQFFVWKLLSKIQLLKENTNIFLL